MRILILGAGATGGYFGGRLVAGGADVTFLVRPGRAEELRTRGLVIHSPLGDLQLDVQTIERPNHAYDLVVLACKAHGLEDAIEAVLPAIGPDTMVLPLLNGLRHLATLDERLPHAIVLGGLCHVGVTLAEDGEIHHLNTLQHLALGARWPEHEAGARAVHSSLACGGFAPTLSPAIMQAMWEKFVFLTSYAGVTCLMRAPIGVVASTEHGKVIGRELFEECVKVAAASGYPPSPGFAAASDATLTDEHSEGTSSMLRDVRQGHRTEHEHIMGDMFSRATAAGIATPILRLVLTHMQAYDIVRRDSLPR